MASVWNEATQGFIKACLTLNFANASAELDLLLTLVHSDGAGELPSLNARSILSAACTLGDSHIIEALFKIPSFKEMSTGLGGCAKLNPLHQLPLHTALLHGRQAAVQKLLHDKVWASGEIAALDDKLECNAICWAGMGSHSGCWQLVLRFLREHPSGALPSTADAAALLAGCSAPGSYPQSAWALLEYTTRNTTTFPPLLEEGASVRATLSALLGRLAALRSAAALEAQLPWEDLERDLELDSARKRDVWAMHVAWDVALCVHGCPQLALRPHQVFSLAQAWEPAQRPALRHINSNTLQQHVDTHGQVWQQWGVSGQYAAQAAVDTALSRDTPRGDMLWIPEHLQLVFRKSRERRENYILFEYGILSEQLEGAQLQLPPPHWVAGQRVRHLLPQSNRPAPQQAPASKQEELVFDACAGTACPLQVLLELDAVCMCDGLFAAPRTCLQLLIGWAEVAQLAVSKGVPAAHVRITAHLRRAAAGVVTGLSGGVALAMPLDCRSGIVLRDCLLASCLLVCHTNFRCSSVAQQLGCRVGPPCAVGDTAGGGAMAWESELLGALLRWGGQLGLLDATPRHIWVSCVVMGLLGACGSHALQRIPGRLHALMCCVAWTRRHSLILHRLRRRWKSRKNVA